MKMIFRPPGRPGRRFLVAVMLPVASAPLAMAGQAFADDPPPPPPPPIHTGMMFDDPVDQADPPPPPGDGSQGPPPFVPHPLPNAPLDSPLPGPIPNPPMDNFAPEDPDTPEAT